VARGDNAGFSGNPGFQTVRVDPPSAGVLTKGDKTATTPLSVETTPRVKTNVIDAYSRFTARRELVDANTCRDEFMSTFTAMSPDGLERHMTTDRTIDFINENVSVIIDRDGSYSVLAVVETPPRFNGDEPGIEEWEALNTTSVEEAASTTREILDVGTDTYFRQEEDGFYDQFNDR
jgi:hypothetical protein